MKIVPNRRIVRQNYFRILFLKSISLFLFSGTMSAEEKTSMMALLKSLSTSIEKTKEVRFHHMFSRILNLLFAPNCLFDKKKVI